MNQRRYKRKIYIVDPDFQYGLIRKIAAIAVLIIIMSLSFMVSVYYLYGDVQIEVAQPDPFALEETVSTLPQQVSLIKLLWPVLFICLLVTLIFIFLFGVIISHRMAGPIYRAKRTLEEMALGDLRGDVRFRKKDDFKSLAESINSLKLSWRMRIKELKGLFGKLDTGDEALKKDTRDRINQILSGFKSD